MDKQLEELLQNGFNDYDFDKAKEMFREIIEGLVPAVSFAKFNELVSEDLDKAILDVIKTGRTYVGGSLVHTLVSDKEWETEYTFYTQDKDGKFGRNKGKAGPFKMFFLDEESRAKLLEKKKVEFELLPPKSDIKEKEVTEKLDEQETSFGKDVAYETKTEK
ncbi:MAG: hypothetical protein MJ048_04650 [Acidaminococcaceae bacterium]|nr:hypothetical protein [Acidaminococcaceae bacterium]